MRRIVHYTDDADSPVSGTESINDVWQGFRYDFFMLLCEIEKAELSRDAKSALCTELQYLLSDMSCGVEKMSDYVDFMAKWREGFSETPVKESPVKKRRGKSETTSGGTAEGLFPDASDGNGTEPGEDADKGTPKCADSVASGLCSESCVTDGTRSCEEAAEGTDVSFDPADEVGTNLGEDAENEDSYGFGGEAERGPEGDGETCPVDDATEESCPEEAAEDATTDCIVMAYASKEETSQALFAAEHGPEEDEDEGTGKDGGTLIKTINSLYSGDAENGGAEGDLRPDNETED